MPTCQPDCESIFESYFTQDVCSAIRESICQAYNDVHPDVQPHLYAGREKRAAAGMVRRALVSQHIEENFKNRELPFTCISNEFGRTGHDNLVMASKDGKVVFTCKVVSAYLDLPPNSNLRSMLRTLNESNALGIEFEDELPTVFPTISEAVYFLVTYGPSTPEPSFVAIGVPEMGVDDWKMIRKIPLDPIESGQVTPMYSRIENVPQFTIPTLRNSVVQASKIEESNNYGQAQK